MSQPFIESFSDELTKMDHCRSLIKEAMRALRIRKPGLSGVARRAVEAEKLSKAARPRWHLLDVDGGLVHDLPRRPRDAAKALRDKHTPWYKTVSHLHGKPGAVEGIHFYGDKASAQEALTKARNGEYLLQFD